MALNVKSFSSIDEFIKDLESQISDIRRKLEEYLKRVEEAKARAEMYKKFEEVLGKFAGGPITSSKELSIGELRVIVNPPPATELEALVNVVRDLQNRLAKLERIRRDIEPLRELTIPGLKIEVIYEDDVPVRVFIRLG